MSRPNGTLEDGNNGQREVGVKRTSSGVRRWCDVRKSISLRVRIRWKAADSKAKVDSSASVGSGDSGNADGYGCVIVLFVLMSFVSGGFACVLVSLSLFSLSWSERIRKEENGSTRREEERTEEEEDEEDEGWVETEGTEGTEGSGGIGAIGAIEDENGPIGADVISIGIGCCCGCVPRKLANDASIIDVIVMIDSMIIV